MDVNKEADRRQEPDINSMLLEEALQLQTGDNMVETDGKPVA